MTVFVRFFLPRFAGYYPRNGFFLAHFFFEEKNTRSAQTQLHMCMCSPDFTRARAKKCLSEILLPGANNIYYTCVVCPSSSAPKLKMTKLGRSEPMFIAQCSSHLVPYQFCIRRTLQRKTTFSGRYMHQPKSTLPP